MSPIYTIVCAIIIVKFKKNELGEWKADQFIWWTIDYFQVFLSEFYITPNVSKTTKTVCKDLIF